MTTYATLTPVRLTPGIRVGPYEVVALLGAGGMGEVYRARDTRLGRDVAIKFVAEAVGGDGASLERFEQEAKVAGSLNHPNVVVVFDVGRHEGAPYLVTELLQGETLRQRLAKGPIALDQALDWAAQVARGLAAAHAQGRHPPRREAGEHLHHPRRAREAAGFRHRQAHRGARRGSWSRQLLDSTAGGSEMTVEGQVFGTPSYMSPEQVRGEPVDARTDLFSLGAVLHEMVTGERAFPAGPAVEIRYAILHHEPEALPPIVPPLVAQVVLRCLEKDPALRYQSARDLAFNLELLRSPTGSTPTATTTPDVTTKTSRWRRLRWPLLGTVAALGLLAAAFLIGRDTRPLMPSIDSLTFGLGTVSGARFSPEGRVVYSAAWNGQPPEVFSQSTESYEAQALGLRDMDLLGVSRTGELAVRLRTSGYFKGTLAVVPGAGGAPREVSEDVTEADWGPNGELAAVRVVGAGYRLEYPLGTPLFEAPLPIYSPRVSPQGDRVAFFASNPSDTGFLELVLVDRKGRTQTLSTANIENGLAWAPSGDEVWFDAWGSIWASPLSGGRRRVYQAVSNLRLEDISRDGRVLVNVHQPRREIAFIAAAQKDQRALGLFTLPVLATLSDDGRQVLFTAFPGEATAYLRPTDGSPPLKLGPGWASDLSPDGKWVLATSWDFHHGLSLLPVGAGTPRALPLPGLKVTGARWLHDRKRILFMGETAEDKQVRLYIVPIEGEAPVALPSRIAPNEAFEVSSDDRFVATRGLDAILTLYPLDGGTPVPLPELGRDADAIRWTAEGQLWARVADIPTRGRLVRFDIANRRVLEERTVAPADSTGLNFIGHMKLTLDGRAIAFDYGRTLGNLIILDGLAPPRR